MYNKLFTKILDSSIWLEPLPTRVVWITMIACMDQDSYCHFSAVENLARRAGVSLEDTQEAVKCFENPDKNSGDPEFEGRRVERVPGGWLILNGQKYRETYKKEIARTQTAERVKRFRERHSKKPLQSVTPPLQTVSVTHSLDIDTAIALEVLLFLNNLSGRKYRPTTTNFNFIKSRMKEEGVTLDGVKQMLERQCKRWIGTKFEEYLKPETIFNKTKFDGYYAAKDLPINTNESNDGKMRPRHETFSPQDLLAKLPKT